MKLKVITKILIVICFLGLSLLLYPSFSNYWNEKHSTKVLNNYTEELSKIDEDTYETYWKEAVEYNKTVFARENQFRMSDEEKEKYKETLNISGKGLMGYVDIPSLGVSLPIYHGTDDSILQYAIGHLDWSSLPTGGESTHCVISGHRGLPSAKLFTEINKMHVGDVFTLTVLGEHLTYEVDQIRTVLPNDTTELAIVKGKDLCTLVTCTPYGINTHRLLVRGHRIETSQAASVVVSEAVMVNKTVVAACIALPLVFVLFMIVMLKKPKKSKKEILAEVEKLNEKNNG